MKKVLGFLLLLLILPSLTAINIEVEQISADKVMISELQKPMDFKLEIKNKGVQDRFEFYNLAGFQMLPIGFVDFNTMQKKTVPIQIMPIGKFNHIGPYTLKYYIRSEDDSEVQRDYTFRVVKLEDAFEVGATEFDSETESITIYIQNREQYDFENLSVKFSSVFFDLEEEIQLDSLEKKEFTIELNKEDFKKVMAGYYTLSAKVTVEKVDATIEGTLKFIEKDILKSEEKDYGFLISTKVISKENQGNTLSESTTVIEKNIITRSFTTFSPEPNFVERQGFDVFYTWKTSLNPGETLDITVKTNYLFPFFVILFLVLVVVLAKHYSQTDLVLRKRVSFVRSKTGEFALKVSIFVKAKNYVEGISIVDRLPPLVKIHEKFINETPRKIDAKARKIEWGYDKLDAGEVRVLSYVLYSKVGILGRFALPSTFAIYSKDGKIKETNSNKAFFVSDVKGKDFE